MSGDERRPDRLAYLPGRRRKASPGPTPSRSDPGTMAFELPVRMEGRAPMSAAAFAVETADFTKVYGKRIRAVDRLNLSVRNGEVYGFLGPNGAGKTTTLRMLLGLVHASAGRALVLGRPPGDPASLARVGAMVEEPAFYPYLSGRDNLRVVARFAGLAEDGIDAALDEVDLLGRAGDR